MNSVTCIYGGGEVRGVGMAEVRVPKCLQSKFISVTVHTKLVITLQTYSWNIYYPQLSMMLFSMGLHACEGYLRVSHFRERSRISGRLFTISCSVVLFD